MYLFVLADFDCLKNSSIFENIIKIIFEQILFVFVFLAHFGE